MEVHVRVPTQLRDVTNGERSVTVHVDDDAAPTVDAVLDALATAHPALERRIRDERGGIRPHVNLFVGADNVRDLDGTATTLAHGQDLSVIPVVSGG
jgi:molybdopterin synthase sulfur carrier subunit